MHYNFQPLGYCKIGVAMTHKHPLAKKKILDWKDIDNETLILLKRGKSYVLDELRDEILKYHTSIKILDIDDYYDISIFNLCKQQEYLMETLDIWENLHPMLKTVPVLWKYKMPYGLLYAKQPSDKMKIFINTLQKNINL